MKTNLIGLFAVAALAVSAGAFAQDCNSPQQVGGYVVPTAPVSYARTGGHYETRNIQQWVPGHYQQVYVPFVTHGRFHTAGGRMENRWIAGSYASVPQQVWVSNDRVHSGHRPVAQARVGVRVGFR